MKKHEFKKSSSAEITIRPGTRLNVKIANLNDEGLGISEHLGKPVYVSNAFPGEELSVRATFNTRRGIFASPIRFHKKSPVRVSSSLCPHTGHCDNCPLIQMEYGAQLAWKKGLVSDAMRRHRSLFGVLVHDVIPSAKSLNYRNSAKLAVAGKFTDPVIGIYRRNSHDVIDIGDCPLHHPLINRIVKAVKEGIRKCKVPIYIARSESGILRHLVIRVSESTEQAMVIFVTSQRNYNDILHLGRHVQAAVPQVTVVAQNVNSSTGNVILGPKDHFLTTKKSLVDSIGPIQFNISPRSFFQVNNSGATSIYGKVREWAGLTGIESVIDLYCGIGGISLFLAGGARNVLGIEVVDAAVVDAAENARLNGIENCAFKVGDASKILHELHEEGTKCDLLVLNPPRKGCDENVLIQAAALAPEKMIYVSCSPGTLARDLDILAQHGYKTLEVQPVDMFPQTTHIENVALIVKS